MHYTQLLNTTTITTQLQDAIYQPIRTTKTSFVFSPLLRCCEQCAHIASDGAANLGGLFAQWAKSKQVIGQHINPYKHTTLKQPLLYLASALMFCMPTKSLTGFEGSLGLQKIALTGSLVVAMPHEQLFMGEQYRHGFGLDSAKRYANYLGVNLVVEPYASESDALKAVEAGKADIVIGSQSKYDANSTLNGVQIGCGTVNLSEHGLNPNTSFTLKNTNVQLLSHIKNYLCHTDTMASTAAMAKFYQTNGLNAYSQAHFSQAMTERLPAYKNTFKTQAKKYNHDWQLLAAISYQESHLKADAVSPTGVEGIMMLTNDTAKAMGVSDRTNPTQSIQGGAKYLNILQEKFGNIPEEERLWFVLAAYNMGPNAVKSIQNKLSEQGKNPYLWSHFYEYLSANAKHNSRYVQCMHYVTNIRNYLELLKGGALT